jgi:predicted AAA+ superfamily ATPase
MERYIKRDLESEIEKYLTSKEILAIVGPRRCGKTTIINKILDSQKGKINRINFDDVKTLRLFEEDIDAFINKYIKGFDILFIDEVQYSNDSGKKLKYIYDNHWVKIIISGSSATEISIQSLKYLVGRIFTFNLYPFSFKEFIRAKNKNLENYLSHKKISDAVLEELNESFEEYLLYGGYPRVVLSDSIEEKKKVLEGIFNTYLLREVKEILGLSESYKLINLVKALSLQIGNIVNYNELCKVSGFKFLELKKYLNILEKTFILKQIKPFFTNKKNEITKAPKIYFYDSGFRNIIIDNFQKERADKGAIYENFVFTELISQGKELKYWNTKSKAEVDFILEKEKDIIPIEVKSMLKKEGLTKSFRSFVEKYNPSKGYFLSKDYFGKTKLNLTKISFYPFILVSSLF